MRCSYLQLLEQKLEYQERPLSDLITTLEFEKIKYTKITQCFKDLRNIRSYCGRKL